MEYPEKIEHSRRNILSPFINPRRHMLYILFTKGLEDKNFVIVHGLDKEKFRVEGKPIDLTKYHIHIVKGDGLKQKGIYNKDVILIARINASDLKKGDILVYKDDKDAKNKLKIREFIATINLSEETTLILEELKGDIPIKDRSIIEGAINKEKEDWKEGIIHLTIRYNNNVYPSVKLYSLHSSDDLYGKKEFKVDKKNSGSFFIE